VGTFVRDAPRQPWRLLRRWQMAEPGKYIGLSRDGTTFYMAGSLSEDAGAVCAVDLATGEQRILAQDPNCDVEDVFVHPLTREIQAVGFYKEKLEWQVLDPRIADDFTALAKVHEGEFSVVQPPWESPILFSK